MPGLNFCNRKEITIMEDLYTYDSGNYSDYMGGSSFDSPLSSLDESAMTILAVMGIIVLVIFIL